MSAFFKGSPFATHGYSLRATLTRTMGNASSKSAGNVSRLAKQVLRRPTSAGSEARPPTLPPAEGARPPQRDTAAPTSNHRPVLPPAEGAKPSPVPQAQQSRLHASEIQDDRIIRDGSDPQLESAPDPLYASHLAALGQVNVGKPRLKLARNDRMLEILSGRQREASLDPHEVAAAQLRGERVRPSSGPSVPLGSRATKDTRLGVSVLLDLLSARTQATHPRHVTALAQEFGLDEHTVEALARRFGAPREVDEESDPAPRSRSSPEARSWQERELHETNRHGKERSSDEVHEIIRQEQELDVQPESKNSPSNPKRKLLTWIAVPNLRQQPES